MNRFPPPRPLLPGTGRDYRTIGGGIERWLCISSIEYKQASPFLPSTLAASLSSRLLLAKPGPLTPLLQSFFWHSRRTTVCSTIVSGAREPLPPCSPFVEFSHGITKRKEGGMERGREEGNRSSDDYTAVKVVHIKGRIKEEERSMFRQTCPRAPTESAQSSHVLALRCNVKYHFFFQFPIREERLLQKNPPTNGIQGWHL